MDNDRVASPNELLLEQAEDLLEDEEAEQALATVRSLHGTPLPSSVRGRAFAVEVVSLEQLDLVDDADRLVAEFMRHEAGDFQFILAAGMEFTDLEAFDHAEVFLGNLCELDPDSPLPWYNLAITYGRDERFHEAIQAYDHALERDPNFAPAYLQKGYCLRLMGQPDQAFDFYRKYLAMEPEDGDAWCSLALMESERGDFSAAYEHFAKALEASIEPDVVYFNWALTAAQRNDDSRVMWCLQRLEMCAPESWRTMLIRAEVAEADQLIWDAWECIVEAFEIVIEEGDIEEADYVAGSLLRFAFQNDLEEHLEAHLRTIFEFELFSDEVLELLRMRRGRSSHAVASFQVVLRSAGAEPDDPPEYFVYGVFAENADDAAAEAISFQRGCGDADWEWDSAQRISEFDEGVTGVYWRSECMDAPPQSVEDASS